MANVSSSGQKNYGGSYRTMRGEVVKSLAEVQIADYFNVNRIKYAYEDTAKTTQSAFRTKISKPDFYLPDYEVYVEYWGLVDVGDWTQRNKYREDMNWKMRQYANNGIKFISLYPWNLKDLDGAFRAEFKKVFGRDLVSGAVGEKSIYALPLANGFTGSLRVGVSPKLKLLGLDLVYAPYYFIEYDCFAQTTFFYERVSLSSRGILVLEGVKGQVVDMALQSGDRPDIASMGNFATCAQMEQVEIPRSKLSEIALFAKVDSTPIKISSWDAEKIARVEIARNLHKTFTKNPKNRTAQTTLTPFERDIRIVSTKLSQVPLVTATFTYKDKIYQRTMQCATSRIIADDMMYCNMRQNHFVQGEVLMCDDCGRLICGNHSKQCSICATMLCEEHIFSKGLLMKKYYCRDHVPKT